VNPSRDPGLGAPGSPDGGSAHRDHLTGLGAPGSPDGGVVDPRIDPSRTAALRSRFAHRHPYSGVDTRIHSTSRASTRPPGQDGNDDRANLLRARTAGGSAGALGIWWWPSQRSHPPRRWDSGHQAVPRPSQATQLSGHELAAWAAMTWQPGRDQVASLLGAGELERVSADSDLAPAVGVLPAGIAVVKVVISSALG
jgi:hypothetical protein